jgi:tRNA dimethylallyltransferase
MQSEDPAHAPALVIGGPTASGKSALALALAEQTGGEIINADAFQIYRGLPLLTAQPSAQELARAPHQLIAEFELSEPFDAARYMRIARERIISSWAAGRLPILVGGTGLYIRAVLYGLAAGLPGPDPTLRNALESRPLEDLRLELLALDPQSATLIDLQNPRRVIRALEVCLLTGRPFTSFRDADSKTRPVVGTWISLPRDTLHQKIESRARQLFEKGVAEEIRVALPLIGTNAKQAIGVDAVSDVLAGDASEDEAVQRIIFSTRQYARRQETWFRKEPALKALPPEEALPFCLQLLAGQRA